MDPYCPHCKAFLNYLRDKRDYTLYIYFLPINAKSSETINKIVCDNTNNLLDRLLNPDKTEEKTEIKKDSQTYSKEQKCVKGEELMEKHIILAQSLRITAVPFIILENGNNFYGFDQKILDEFFK